MKFANAKGGTSTATLCKEGCAISLLIDGEKLFSFNNIGGFCLYQWGKTTMIANGNLHAGKLDKGK